MLFTQANKHSRDFLALHRDVPVDLGTFAPILLATAWQAKALPDAAYLTHQALPLAPARKAQQPITAVIQHKNRLHKVVVSQQRRLRTIPNSAVPLNHLIASCEGLSCPALTKSLAMHSKRGLGLTVHSVSLCLVHLCRKETLGFRPPHL